MSKKKKKKNERRSFDFNDGNIEIARWNDNSVITIGSNAYGVQLIGSAKRSENRKKEKRKGKVTIRSHFYCSMYHIHCLKMFRNCCHINKQFILSISNVFLTCQPQTIERNLS